MAQRRIGIAVPGREATRAGSKRLWAICGVIAALLLGLKIYGVIAGRGNGLDQAVVAASAPVPQTLEHSARGLGSLLQIFRLPSILHENQQLQQENLYLRGRVDAAQSAVAENDTLRKQLGMSGLSGCRALHAAVIARPFDLWVENVILNVGTEAGVQPGCLVASPAGLAGKVTEAGAGFCRVELVTSPKFRVAAVVKPGGYEGLVRGVAPGELSVDYIQALANINPGDKVYSRGGEHVPAKAGVPADPRTPRDVFIGQVVEKSTEQGFLRIKLAPAVDVNRLDTLTVYVE